MDDSIFSIPFYSILLVTFHCILLSYCYRGELYDRHPQERMYIISYVEWGSARDLVIHTYCFVFLCAVRNAMDDRVFWIPVIEGIFDHFEPDRIDLNPR